MPSAKGKVTAASTASMQRCGASKPRFDFLSDARYSSKMPGSLRAASILSSSWLTRAQRLARDALGERGRAGREVALDELVEQAELLGARGADRIARGDHLERRPHADQARQPLRATRAGQEPELDLGQPALRRRHGHPVVAGQRDLEPAAERGAVDRGHDRLLALLDRLITAGSPGGACGLPNSRMSAPAMKVRPLQTMTPAASSGSAAIFCTASSSPCRTP